MREIVLDTETTGLDPATGDRIVEIGAVEIVNYLPTGRTYHQYIDPQRPMPADAFAVHGLGDEFLRGKPVFNQIAAEFLAFIGDAPLVIHNASFDMRFLNAELKNCGHPELPHSRAVDTLALARDKLPGGASASLDSLCQRFGIDNSGRELHGALLDSQLLAEVYLELVGGRQTTITFASETIATGPADDTVRALVARRPRPVPLPSRLSEAEAAAHAALVARMGPGALWLASA
ncbi:DNA polymerase III subunit epsilon [Paracoccus suum]|uniref:DNA polymerase III subunit epsilon n=1 Tax=Paracoccus suum TaxID=2259340 RepID=A0A344PHR9_9RHOB|nr:DNA polymerase III subunit epsilon [Paracoccus suum]AXC48924.1 DNA polymerase III subunit epsilon [Paracoccus suum]